MEQYKVKYPTFDIIDKVVQQQGLKVTILLRLSPLIFFSALNCEYVLLLIVYSIHFGCVADSEYNYNSQTLWV